MTVFTSPLPSLAPRRQSITDRLFEGLAYEPDRDAVIDGPSGAALTAAELRSRIEHLAGGLQASGVGPGTMAAIFAPNLPDYATAFHGVAYAGGSVTTINPTYTAHELGHQLADSGATMIFTLSALLPLVEEAITDTDVSRVVTFDAGGPETLEDLMGDPLDAQIPVDLETHTVVLPYSSGTTGLPKGVRLSHRNLVANVDQFIAALEIYPGETTLAFLPFFHIYGMNVLMNAFLGRGAGLVTMSRFDLEAFLGHIQNYRIRQIMIAPPVALALAKHPLVDEFDLSSLEVLISGAAPLGADVAAAVGERLGSVMMQGYGLTETSPVTHVCPVTDVRPGSVGIIVPDTECRIVDPETGKDLGPNQEGELWMKGPQIMLGYHNAPEATAETLTDGWLHTGDLAMFDADGHCYIRDRLKELIKVSGFQVAPAELEAELIGHPDIADAAVIGMPDPKTGERILAFIVPRQGTEPDPDAIIGFLSDKLASYKRPTEIRTLEAIPKSASGKILRRVLKTEMAPQFG